MTREERDDAINCFKNKIENEVYGSKYNKLALEALEQEPKIGHKVSGDLLGGLYCSECMTYVNEYFNYCPHCGAKMENEVEE